MYLRCGYCGYLLHWIKGELGRCTECQAKVWVALDTPKTPYTLTRDDSSFLRSIRVRPEV